MPQKVLAAFRATHVLTQGTASTRVSGSWCHFAEKTSLTLPKTLPRPGGETRSTLPSALLIRVNCVFSRTQMFLISQPSVALRSEEHTSELQSLRHLVCRLLL